MYAHVKHCEWPLCLKDASQINLPWLTASAIKYICLFAFYLVWTNGTINYLLRITAKDWFDFKLERAQLKTLPIGLKASLFDNQENALKVHSKADGEPLKPERSVHIKYLAEM